MPLSINLPQIGNGFKLRDFTPADITRFAEIEFDPEVKRYLALPTKEKGDWIRTLDVSTYDGWAIEVDNVLAGRASLLKVGRGVAELAIVLDRRFWSVGLGRKVAALLLRVAFIDLRAIAILGTVHPENKASIAILRSFKFRRHGVVTDSLYPWQIGRLIYRLPKATYDRESGKIKLP